MNKVLVVAAHPDDEILGVGAAIAKRIQGGDTAVAIILGEGQTSRYENGSRAGKQAVEMLHQDSLGAAGIIGFENVIFENLPDNRFDTVPMLSIVKKVESVIQKMQPNIIYTHHASDLNIDHRLTFEAVITATRPMKNCCVKEIYTFETVSSTEWNFNKNYIPFCPNVFVDIEGYLEIKIKAMEKYQSELCEFPHPRSLINLENNAKRWGSMIGCNVAEAFELIRKIE